MSAAPIFLNVAHDDDDTVTPIGQLALGERGRLAVAQVATGYETALDDILQAVNAQEEFPIKVPPTGEGQRGIGQRIGLREDPDLLRVLRIYLQQRYSLLITPAS